MAIITYMYKAYIHCTMSYVYMYNVSTRTCMCIHTGVYMYVCVKGKSKGETYNHVHTVMYMYMHTHVHCLYMHVNSILSCAELQVCIVGMKVCCMDFITTISTVLALQGQVD